MFILGVKKIVKATRYTIDGMRVLWCELAFRQEIYGCFIATPIILFLSVEPLLKLMMFLLLLLLLVIEAINTAIEATVDRISLEINSQSKIAKDLGSAAVLLTIFMNVIVWAYALFFAKTL